MKVQIFVSLIIVSCMLATGTAVAVCAEASSGQVFPFDVAFELGEAEFAPGDNINIQSVHGTASSIVPGQSYRVTGTYSLTSREEADLALFVTTTNSIRSSVEPSQIVRVQKGTGTFQLIKTLDAEGYPHLSFYPAAGGNGFGGLYFGHGQSVLHQKGFKYLNQNGGAERNSSGAPVEDSPIAKQNRSILEYLGDPVTAPAPLDRAYTKEGLTAAMELAARNAGVALNRLEIDNSEFPYLVGFTCGERDYPKLVEQIKKMEAYEERGGVSSSTCYAMNIIPWRVFPSESSQRISRRLLLREQMFYDRLNRGK